VDAGVACALTVRLLVLNCGSATVKYRLYEGARADALAQVAGATLDVDGEHRAALARILETLPWRPDAVGHRVVHGGTRLRAPARITPEVEEEIRRLAVLAPLHNPPALAGIASARTLGVPMVACFDTAFHATLPARAWRYALPESLGAEIRRYGFHGLSHEYVTARYAELAGEVAPTIVSLHLGGGCSAAAIRDGTCVDTSMGMGPLEGLVMGTRAGDVDPTVLLHLLRRGETVESLDRLLHRESGLAALAGTSDMRRILEREDEQARFAVQLFCYRVRRYVGAYLAVLEGARAIVFTGGIGENAPQIRRKVCEGFGWAGLRLDETRNAAVREGRISEDEARLHVWVVPTDEEALIARRTAELLGGAYS